MKVDALHGMIFKDAECVDIDDTTLIGMTNVESLER